MTLPEIYLICYDITDNKKRLKVAKLLIQWGYERFQKSIFTGLQNPAENGRLWKQLEKLLDSKIPNGDKLVVLNVTKPHFRNMQIIGNTEIDVSYLLGEKYTEYV